MRQSINKPARLAPAGTFALLHTTPAVRRRAESAPLRTAEFRHLGGNPSRPGALGSLCDSLRTYGCNVNPFKAGTTRGEG